MAIQLNKKNIELIREKQIKKYLNRQVYIPKRFSLAELVPQETLEKYKGREWIAWRKFDKAFLITIDVVAEVFGSVTYINTYIFKSTYLNQRLCYSGYRPDNCGVGALDSTHRDWNTGDLKFKDFRGERINIIKNKILEYERAFPFITAIEGRKFAPTWLHLTTANFGNNKSIDIIVPKED